MRNGSNARRTRGRNNNNNGRRNVGRSNNTVYDSNGPEGRLRGTAQQVYDKYIAQASDAAAVDDQVLSQSLYQHAEHYLRVLLNDTDIDVEIYRREQMNKGQDTSIDDDSNNADNEAFSSSDDNNNHNTSRQSPKEHSSQPPKRRNDNNSRNTSDNGKDSDRMTDVPGFLASSPQQEKTSKQQKELEAELA